MQSLRTTSSAPVWNVSENFNLVPRHNEESIVEWHDHEKDEDVDHESVKEQNAVSVEAAVIVDDVSAGEEMVTAAEEDITDPGTYSIAEEILRVIF